MPRTKSSQKTSKSTIDIKSTTKKKASDFQVREIKDDDAPEVEPLVEDEVNKVEMDIDYEPARPPTMDVKSVTEEEEPKQAADFAITDMAAVKDVVKVKFGTFVQLISNRDLGDIFEANANKDIVMSSDLLTEMASSRDKREEKKIPLVFLVGIAIGVVLTYIFFST